MKDLVKMTVVLGLICVLAALALSQVYRVTKEPIAAALEAEAKEAAAAVLAPVLTEGAQMLKGEGGPAGEALFSVELDGAPVGYAFRVMSDKGYSGLIAGMLGVDAAGNVLGYRVVQHSETPGLGANIQTDEGWLRQLVFKVGDERRNLTNNDWRVKKDGGEIDALTGATISPRAVAGSIQAGLTWFAEQHGQAAPAEVADAPPAEPTPDATVEEGGAIDPKLPAADALPHIEKTPSPITSKTLTE
jgi:H+/Na+-translocating ferredoxin:NAD+ oxidoreductase subunit G